MTIAYGIKDKNKEMAETTVQVALWCVQYRPGLRPLMSVVVKMLEGLMEIPKRPDPFQHLTEGKGTALLVLESDLYDCCF